MNAWRHLKILHQVVEILGENSFKVRFILPFMIAVCITIVSIARVECINALLKAALKVFVMLPYIEVTISCYSYSHYSLIFILFRKLVTNLLQD